MPKKTRAPGAGVKADDGCKDLHRKQVLIDDDSMLILTRIGKGNVSLGIRESARRVKEAEDTKPFSQARHDKRAK